MYRNFVLGSVIQSNDAEARNLNLFCLRGTSTSCTTMVSKGWKSPTQNYVLRLFSNCYQHSRKIKLFITLLLHGMIRKYTARQSGRGRGRMTPACWDKRHFLPDNLALGITRLRDSQLKSLGMKLYYGETYLRDRSFLYPIEYKLRILNKQLYFSK